MTDAWIRYRRYAYAIGALILFGIWLTGCDMPGW